MEFELKALSKEAIPAALERAERYRLLNEPAQAESICLDVLAIDPDNRQALILLLLSLSDQFSEDIAANVEKASPLLSRLDDRYLQVYFQGILLERQARAHIRRTAPGAGFAAYDLLREAMSRYEEAERWRPPGNDEALLRWNTCARTIMAYRLEPRPIDDFTPMLE